jgi:chorismate mutase
MASKLSSLIKRPSSGATPVASSVPTIDEPVLDLQLRRNQLQARVAELQWDLGGMVYEMAIRDRVRVDVLIKHAAELQDADSELQEIERILALEHTAVAGACPNCNAPHSTGAAFCWQCGHAIMRQVDTTAIFSSAQS